MGTEALREIQILNPCPSAKSLQFEEGLHRISISSILDRACLDMTNAVLRN